MDNLTNEIWRPVMGYEGHYEVSSFGNVRGIDRKVKHRGRHRTIPGILLKCRITEWGYVSVYLSGPREKRHFVHRLVCDAFIPNPDNLPQVNHIDCNKLNNNVENLEWVTCSENMQHAHKMGLMKFTEARRSALARTNRNHRKKIIQLDNDGNFIKEWECIKDADNTLKIATTSISRCCRGFPYYVTAGGFKWEYSSNYYNKK